MASADVAWRADFCQHRPDVRNGFHLYEADGNLRWTDGDARLPMALFSGFSRAADIVLYVAATTRYPLLTAAGERAAP